MAGYVGTTEDFDWQPYIGQLNPVVPRNIMPPAGAPPPQSLAMLSGRPASAWMDIVPAQQKPPLQVKSLKIGATETAPRGGGTAPLTEGGVDTTAYDELVKKLNEKGLASLNDQSKGIKDLEAELAKAKTKNPNLDLSALMQLSDNWFGGNLSQGYQRPKTRDELEQAARALEMDIQRERRGLSNSEIDLIKSQLGIEGQRVTAAENRAARKEQFELQLQAIKEQRAARIAAQNDAAKQRLERKGEELAYQQTKDMLKSDHGKKVEGLTNFQANLDKYLQLVGSLGPNVSGPEAAALSSAYNEMSSEFAKAKGLGALSGPDLGIMLGAIQPTGGTGAITSILKGGKQGVLQQANVLRANAAREAEQNLLKLEQGYPKAYPEVVRQYRTNFGLTGAGGATGGGGQPERIIQTLDGKRFRVGANEELEEIQ